MPITMEYLFHGTTLPRGWERMCPNHMGSEAKLWFRENLVFSQVLPTKKPYTSNMLPLHRGFPGNGLWTRILCQAFLQTSR